MIKKQIKSKIKLSSIDLYIIVKNFKVGMIVVEKKHEQIKKNKEK